MSHRRVRDEYDRVAAHYERRWHRYVDAATRRTLRHLDIHPSARILDLGCGTGALLEAIADMPAVRTAGLDLSRRMPTIARGRLAPATALLIGDVTDLPLADQAFSCVVSASSFHFWRRAPGRRRRDRASSEACRSAGRHRLV